MRKRLKQGLQFVCGLVARMLPSFLLAAGAAAVAVGIGQIFPPAGVIAAGALSILGGVLLVRGGGDEM